MSTFFDPTNIQTLKDLGEQTGQDLLGNIVKLYIDTTPPMLTELKELIQKEDFDQAGKVAHKLKSSCANLGFMSLKEVCQEIEEKSDTATAESKEALESLAQQVGEMFEKSLEVLKSA